MAGTGRGMTTAATVEGKRGRPPAAASGAVGLLVRHPVILPRPALARQARQRAGRTVTDRGPTES